VEGRVLIAEIELSLVRNHLVHSFETSTHRKSYLDHIIVRATTVDGMTGWGECAAPADPYFCGETTSSAWHVLADYLCPLLVGTEWETPPDAAGILQRINGNNFARAGLEMACWDLYAQSRAEPLGRTLGGTQSEVVSGVSLGIEATTADLLAQIDKHVTDGYRRVKLKIRPGWDVEPVRAARAEFGDLMLQVDANGSYRPSEVEQLLALDGFGLAMIEQPYPDDYLTEHAELSRHLETPVCLDESITSPAALRTALQLGSCSIVNIKVSRAGGVGPAVAIHDICRAAGVPVWCGGMHEFGIGRAVNLAVASLPGFLFPSDVSGSEKYYAEDIVTPAITAVNGAVVVPSARPGIGVAVDTAKLQQFTRRTRTITRPRP
jgi:O-succinylbenzoate synthase